MGCQLNRTADGGAELGNRMRACVGTWRRLKSTLKHSEWSRAQKLSLWMAIVRAKLLYALEALHLTVPRKTRFDIFHLNGLRQKCSLTALTQNRSCTPARRTAVAAAQAGLRLSRRHRRGGEVESAPGRQSRRGTSPRRAALPGLVAGRYSGRRVELRPARAQSDTASSSVPQVSDLCAP